MKILFDIFPLLVFFGAYKFYDIYWATGAAIIATFVQIGYYWIKTRHFEPMHIITLAVLSIFGGLTIFLHDDSFIKWKPTIVNWLFAAIIFGMLVFSKKSALQHIMGKQIALPEKVWKNLNLAWALFFLVLGALNLYIAFYYNLDADEATRTASWVNFKVFGLFGITLVFAVAQMFFIARYIDIKEEN